jgi:hypothetical protein
LRLGRIHKRAWSDFALNLVKDAGAVGGPAGILLAADAGGLS